VNVIAKYKSLFENILTNSAAEKSSHPQLHNKMSGLAFSVQEAYHKEMAR
jgi:hypothetical protein